MRLALVASTGGHLVELLRLRPRIPGSGDAVWITFDSPQSRDALDGERVVYVNHAGPRQIRPALANLLSARSTLRAHDVSTVVSTGASVALSVMAPARTAGLACHYIESAARIEGPSLTGRLLTAVPGVRLHTQHPAWAGGRWTYAGSVFDGFASTPHTRAEGSLRVLVTLGSQRDFPFPRMVEAVVGALPPDAQVTWQTGSTDPAPFGLEARPFIPAPELRELMTAADVVISHCGVGSALTALGAGRVPLLVPRLERFGEHVDDHQEQVGADLDARGVARMRTPEQLATEDILWAAGQRAVEGPGASAPLDL